MEDPVVDPLIPPFPLMDHEKVAPSTPLDTVYSFPAIPEHTVTGPLMVHDGTALTVTVFVHVAVQLADVVDVTVSVYELALPAVTLTDEPVVEPTIVPPAEIDQLKVVPPVFDDTV